MNDERLARLALSRLCEPGHWAVFAAVEEHGAATVWEALSSGRGVGRISPALAAGAQGRAERHDVLDDVRRLEMCRTRLVVPGDEEWPGERLQWGAAQAAAPPLALFVRGYARLPAVLERSVAVVGARATTVYGTHVAGELALGVADRGWSVISGGAYGVDGAAHRGALDSTQASTVAVLACSVDIAYPRGHRDLLDRIAEEGLLVSEHPPGSAPTRSRFLVRNRLIAALSVGTVVVEAALRSGSLTTARHAGELGRHVMAVPGPVTSAMSAGAHRLLRGGAVCVTSAADVLDVVGDLGSDASPEERGPSTPRDSLPEVTRRVLDAIPVRGWAGPASMARAAGVSTLTVQQLLPPLQIAGLVEEGPSGWRLTPLGAGRPARAAS